MTLAQTQAADAKQLFQQMESKVTSLNRELLEAQKAASKLKDSAGLKKDELVRKLEGKIAELEAANAQLAARADELWARYKDGSLSDKEKEFISYLMNEADSVHEEDVVRKDNELRRRDHTIQALNVKVAELQASVARFIKTQGGAHDTGNKSMVDLKAWLGSSSEHAPVRFTFSSLHRITSLSHLVGAGERYRRFL
ncbi:hypothetical protein BDN70DRAFT_132135 [Pholiota conissans]|uniref:Uncharacterized protein n=1 Tax=Pholiota conissans TaxID=109636 RepID=A0A9P5YXU5_9AGAR|nr:hypothetical protein BDN70DRAFT_132135 [Pholiota conissans]